MVTCDQQLGPQEYYFDNQENTHVVTLLSYIREVMLDHLSLSRFGHIMKRVHTGLKLGNHVGLYQRMVIVHSLFGV